MTSGISENNMSRLNSMLHSEQATVKEITDLILLIKDLTEWKLKVIDFNQYNENYLDQLRRDKLTAIKKVEYEKAAAYRDQEILCEKYIEFKRQHLLERSRFHFEHNIIWYCFSGMNEREAEVLRELQQIAD
jgi:hypothetical protein